MMRAAPLDVPHFFANGLPSSLSSIGGEVSLHGNYGRYLRRVAVLRAGQGDFKSVEGEKTVRSAFGEFLQPTPTV